MSVGDLTERKERPAYVRFERVAVEDKAASSKEGRYIALDVDMALITPPYSKDVFKIKVSQWFENLKQDLQNGRIREEWIDDYHKQYDRWKKGEEIPLNGTAIKGWGVISPAQQATLIGMQVLTVEDLASMNDEGVKRVGMGGNDLKNQSRCVVVSVKGQRAADSGNGGYEVRKCYFEIEHRNPDKTGFRVTGTVQGF